MDTQLTAVAQSPSVDIALIRELATDDRVSVEKLAALMQLHERAESRDARKQFTAAFREASIEMPRIEKKGVIDMGAKGKMSFARYEDVDRIVRDVEIRHGFTRSFLSEPTETGILLTCVLSHAAGHSERSTRWMPPDPGPGRNGMQAIGSAYSYAKRYLTIDVWNIVTCGADDDANRAEPVSGQQALEIKNMLSRLAMEPERLKKFWAWAEADQPIHIQRRNFARIHAELIKRLKESGR